MVATVVCWSFDSAKKNPQQQYSEITTITITITTHLTIYPSGHCCRIPIRKNIGARHRTMILRGLNDPIVHGDHEFQQGGCVGRGTIWSPYLVNMVTLRQSALYTMCRHKHYYVIHFLHTSMWWPSWKSVRHWFYRLPVQAWSWPTLFNPSATCHSWQDGRVSTGPLSALFN